MSDKLPKILGEVIVNGQSEVDPTHAYVATVLAIMKEPFVSSDAKYMMIQSSLRFLEEMGYSSEKINEYAEKMSEIIKEHMTTNSFMG